MCGICGIYDPRHQLDRSRVEQDLSAMTAEFRYRGPDDQGIYVDPTSGLGLGHVRLSIIDLGGGKQPMSNADQTLWIVFNGEIYNFQSERNALESSGYRFQNRSDTEVILALYDRYGPDAWERLRGQFAFGLWDSRKKTLFLVRDRIGEKPLIYGYDHNILFFASELKALLRSARTSRELDPSVLGSYFLTQHLVAPTTLIKGIYKLPPGYFLTATAEGIQLKPYWRPKTTLAMHAQPDDIVAEFKSIFLDAVKSCTVSDVPIGTYLSGGLDSTSVTWGVTKAILQPFHTFAIFNKDDHEKHPDWEYAQEAAADLHTEHHNVFYDLPELMEQIPEYIEKTDEPFGGPWALVSYMLSKYARQYVKVVLTGNGADELLGGYQSYYRQVLKKQAAWQRIDRIPRSLRSLISKSLGGMNSHISLIGMPHGERRIASTLQFHRKWFDLICPNQGAATRRHLMEALAIHHSEDQKNYFKRYLWEDLFIYHHQAITTSSDTLGMACSLEARNPFLDYKLVEFLLGIPPDFLIRHSNQNKYLLVKAVESSIPSSILTRSKEGFSGMTAAQIVHYIRHEGRLLFRGRLHESVLAKQGFLDQNALDQLWERFETAAAIKEAVEYLIPIWAAVMLDFWYDRHILQKSVN